MTKKLEPILDSVNEYYTSKVMAHGATPKFPAATECTNEARTKKAAAGFRLSAA